MTNIAASEENTLTVGATNRNRSALAMQLYLLLLRNEAKITGFQLRRLSRRNAISKAPVISESSGAVVSVTSYGNRLKSVHLLLESIGNGSTLPSRLILWVDTKDAYENPSPQIRRLIDRGLELRLCDNFGPHTKYYPYLLSADAFPSPLVTADDDQLYPRWWLAGLLRNYRQNPENISCYRAHRVGLAGDVLTPYETWEPCKTTIASFRHFATGVSGVIYPPSFLARLKEAGSDFLAPCPKSDDAWLHVQALRAKMPIRQIFSRPLRFPVIPGSQSSGLFHTNVLLSQNDSQISQTYLPGDLAVLRAGALETN